MASNEKQLKQCTKQRHQKPFHLSHHQQRLYHYHQNSRTLNQSKNLAVLRNRSSAQDCKEYDLFWRSKLGKHHGLLAVLLFALLIIQHGHNADAEGNIGCHFVRTLCIDGSEVCYDDNIFGKCIPTTGVDVEDIEKTPLSEHQSRTLATMLEELQGAGLGWDHPYVQCRIQGALFSLQRQTQLPPNLCANLSPDADVEAPNSMAYMRFTPLEQVDQAEPNNVEDYHDTQQLFFAPLKKHGRVRIPDSNAVEKILHRLQLHERRPLRHDPLELEHFEKFNEHGGSQLETPNVMNVFLDTERQQNERRQKLHEALLEEEQKNAQQNQMELYQILAASEPDPQPYQRKQTNAMEQLEQLVEQNEKPPTPVYVPEEVNESSELYFPDNYAPLKRIDVQQQQLQPKENIPVRSFFRELAAEEGLQQAPINRKSYQSDTQATLEANSLPTNKRQRMDYGDIELERQRAFQESLVRNSLTPFEEEAMLASNAYPNHKLRKMDRVFTEGGLIYVPENEMQSDDPGNVELRQSLLANMLGFARHERLDVKKPGPLIGPPPPLPEDIANKYANAALYTGNNGNKEVLPAHIKASDDVHKKKKLIKNHSDDDHGSHSVDTQFAHVFVKNPIDSWSDGVRIMTELANVLHMQGYFTYLTVQPHEVSFRVDSNNPEHKTALDVARTINENKGVKNNILRRLGVTVLRAGVGDKIKADDDGEVSSSRIELDEQSPDVMHIMAYMFAGAGAAAIIVIFVTLILIKRHDSKRDKLGGLQTGNAGTESCSKDYQDLCRARMAGKGNAAEPVTTTSGRITSLSKENERPPSSSRSSTSSWSEEPALTNMDISTGHMVLSYMEDHLRNKGRLQREWDALCRYEAEPSARDAANQPQCANLNRTGAPLPYDHSRVVLNHLANADGLDYVNASTITDHDPRAPVCYVAAQGPLPSTLAHFWQMIWEQGAVVIVALCRLQENGEVACARYWPEEGAEVYHIYEVHLVSEHIWCDDYLVRSFYLKNLRTSETRTVTQFHFLSWPQGGVPTQAKALLDFRRKVNKSYRGRSCPIVVHGSEGAGRTGAYILLDLVLGRMNKGAREIDIAATLEHLRDQRSGLVATRQQFEFVLMAVAEEVHAILKALPANQSNEKRELDKDTTGTTNSNGKDATSSKDANNSNNSSSSSNNVLKEEEETKEIKKKKEDEKNQTKVKQTTTTATTSEVKVAANNMAKSTPGKSAKK